MEDDLAVLGTIAIGHLERKFAVVVIGHLEQHAARRRRVHGTHAVGQVGQALLCHQVKAVGSGVVRIVALGGKAIRHGGGEVSQLMGFASSAAELKVNLAKVNRCGTVLARLGRALIHLFERAVGLVLGIQVKDILASLDLVAGVHYLLSIEALKGSGRGIAVGKGHLGLDGALLGARGLHIASSFDSVGVIVLDDGSLGIERTVTATTLDRNRHRPIGRIVGVAALIFAILDHLIGERLAHVARREGQTTQNTGVGLAIGLRFIVCDDKLTLILVRAQQRLELFD